MSRNFNPMGMDLTALARAAKTVGKDIARTKEELERLINMIIKDKTIQYVKVKKEEIDPETKQKVIKEFEEKVENECTVEDMISAMITLVIQDEKFRKNVPEAKIQQLMIAMRAVKDYEDRKLDSIVPQIRSRIRQDILDILHKAYPTWNSLIPDATNSMLDAMVTQQSRSNQLQQLPQLQQGNIQEM